MIRTVVWNEFRHEKQSDRVAAINPDGLHAVIAEALAEDPELSVSTATLDEPDHGLPIERLNETDVLLWWGHMAHDEVSDELAREVRRRVLEGMGFLALHSAHFAKPFTSLMGTNCSLKWREANEKERLWNIAPGHPITAGMGETIELPNAEMYGERFDIPEPDQLIFISWFQGGEVFRSGCCWNRGHGRVFYFRPGHESYPIYYNPEIRQVLRNAVRWAAPRIQRTDDCPNPAPLEVIGERSVDYTHLPDHLAAPE